MAFIIKPMVTEKMTKITDKSSVERTYKVKGQERTKKAETKYGFIVKPEANKIEIKKEIESLYNVTVLDVNTIRYAVLHPCQRSLSFTVSVLPVVETTPVR